ARLSARMAEVLRIKGAMLMGRKVPWMPRPLVDWSPFVWRDEVVQKPLYATDAAVLGEEPPPAARSARASRSRRERRRRAS
ncbi:MAG TPA: hypothetical protein VFO41_14675, partial [Alphaproteobacteria bacterium]|nr:hypothetical protein [Alphaproteobacteria bacterium]